MKDKVCGIEITNPDKIISGNIKKIDVINYYEKISQYILPFLKDRPLSEIRCHCGFEDCFFKKHPDKNVKKLIEISTKQDLILEAQLGSIEFHPYGSKFKSKNKPDIMIFDLDPDRNVPLATLRKCTLNLKCVLDDLGLQSFLKTSGGKGYHVVVPFKKAKTWASFSKFAQQVAELMVIKYPNLCTTNIKLSERKNKIFIDYLRNKKGATCVAPYSLRAREKLPVSLPIEWNEINKIKPNQVNIKNIKKYLNVDAWKDFFDISHN